MMEAIRQPFPLLRGDRALVRPLAVLISGRPEVQALIARVPRDS